jgi:hypothetical protein
MWPTRGPNPATEGGCGRTKLHIAELKLQIAVMKLEMDRMKFILAISSLSWPT